MKLRHNYDIRALPALTQYLIYHTHVKKWKFLDISIRKEMESDSGKAELDFRNLQW